MGYELVGVEFSGGASHGTLRVYIDHENGVSIDDCASISRQVSAILDVEEPIQQAYDLEVSSPGLDRPLFKLTDFERFSGQPVKIKMMTDVDGRRNFKGVLQGIVDAGFIEVEVDGEIYQLPFTDIGKANLIGQL
ncbi:MAG: ribosome maturation factor RimP [Gammaproteobacteria bacterium]|nr:ribosome maturation factor RimP [Gammaproteobacteria bacterium]